MATQAVVPDQSFWGSIPLFHVRTHPAPAPRRLAAKSLVRLGTGEHLRALRQHLARQQLVVKLLPLVKRMALQVRERLPQHVDVEDLVSTGVLGLVDAVRKFDARKHVKLESYARYRIHGAILDGLRGLDHASRDMRKKSKKVESVYRGLEVRLSRAPSDDEIAAGLGISLQRWYRTVRELQTLGMEWLRPMGSVGNKESRQASEESLVADNQEHQFHSCYRREQREILDHALGRIPERERQVVQLYYDQELTMKEIGRKLGVDESRVSQLHSAALAHLRLRVQEMVNHPRPRALQFA
jgi:RNA polymerase sigma factor for flagellar operon FliA